MSIDEKLKLAELKKQKEKQKNKELKKERAT